MIVVLASRLDPGAVALVESWSAACPGEVLLSAAEDLGRAGWDFDPARPQDGHLVAAGRVVTVRDLTGVLVRRPAVAPEELTWLHPADRSYGAAELNAFFVAWLSALPCTVLGRPGPTCLCGPGWASAQWRLAAQQAGLVWDDGAGAADAADRGPCREVVVCGTTVTGAADPAEASAVRALSAAAGAGLLGVRFHGRAVTSATCLPSLAAPGVANVLLDELRRLPCAA